MSFLKYTADMLWKGSSESRMTFSKALDKDFDVNKPVPYDVSEAYANYKKRSGSNMLLSVIEVLGGYTLLTGIAPYNGVNSFDSLGTVYNFIKDGVANGSLIIPLGIMADGVRRGVSEYVYGNDLEKKIRNKIKYWESSKELKTGSPI